MAIQMFSHVLGHLIFFLNTVQKTVAFHSIKGCTKTQQFKIHHTVSFDRMQELISYFSTQYANQLAVTAVKLVGNREHFFFK